MLPALASPTTTLILSPPLLHFNPLKLHKPISFNKPPILTTRTHSNTTTNSSSFNFTTSPEFTTPDIHWDFGDNQDFQEDEDEGCPWEGAVMYKRNAGVSHLEYCTTLERLGLAKLSSECSKSRASQMGLRVLKTVKEKYHDGTPVLVSVDVCRRKHKKLRLDGIVRTVLSLNCNRCGEPAAQSVYSNFSLLLCEEPIEESETIDMGVILGDDKSNNIGMDEDEENDALIDLDDRLYFPLDQKIIDISKNIRDLIHIEITINALCNPNCKGLCLQCGSNLNISRCSCETRNVEEKGYGPLGDLRKQMQQT